jgi:multiple sugar transport system permease protein
VTWAFPLFWSVATTMVPREPDGSILDALAMYGEVLIGTKIGLWYLNSLVTSGAVTLGVLAISATCGYALSQIEFTGRRVLWLVILASFMIPVQALIVNHFMLMNQ